MSLNACTVDLISVPLRDLFSSLRGPSPLNALIVLMVTLTMLQFVQQGAWGAGRGGQGKRCQLRCLVRCMRTALLISAVLPLGHGAPGNRRGGLQVAPIIHHNVSAATGASVYLNSSPNITTPNQTEFSWMFENVTIAHWVNGSCRLNESVNPFWERADCFRNYSLKIDSLKRNDSGRYHLVAESTESFVLTVSGEDEPVVAFLLGNNTTVTTSPYITSRCGPPVYPTPNPTTVRWLVICIAILVSVVVMVVILACFAYFSYYMTVRHISGVFSKMPDYECGSRFYV